MKRKFLSNKKGMSIVISTVIIIAISITMSIAVAFWAMGVGNSFTRFEKIEFVSIYADTTTVPAQLIATYNPANGQIASITIVNGGSGYTAASYSITFSGGGGSGAVATAYTTNFVITSIGFSNRGSGYTSAPTATIPAPTLTSFPVYIQLKNTGSAAATINNVFLDGKPFNVVGASTNLISGTAQNTVLQVGQRRNDFYILLPMGSTWSSGDYVEVEIETSAGRQYSNTVLLP